MKLRPPEQTESKAQEILDADITAYAEDFIDGAERKKRGPGRPSFPWEGAKVSDKPITFNIRMSAELHLKIEYLAKKRDVSKHKLLIRILEKEIEKLVIEAKRDK